MTIVIVGIAFGIGYQTSQAASTPANLQPATGQTEYHSADRVASEEAVQAVSEGHGDEGAEGSEAEEGVVGMFGLNWKLFLAQLINFGIILFVLWKWVFGPVTKGLSQRTAKIEDSLKDAQKIAEERETFDSWKQGEIGQVRAEATQIISKAKTDAEKMRQEILDLTKKDQEKLVIGAQEKLEQEKQAMLDSVKNELAELVVSATESVLKQKLDPKKDAQIIEQALSEAKSKGAEMKGSA